ncbi:Integral membrane family protein [Lasiodiplodia theobromae]|uniref:Integral membrane family protein n=1 Tax=Lasiodiplodia theobromae TaxID=45133 RepID=UPI0015C34ADF|nr:Integral membrane family protein [Lasiodiplodia theobromae]KAF4537190.1 Integral membrane family protein [Lasiodiplodia theobromae]
MVLYDNSRYLAFCVIVLLTSSFVSLILRVYVRLAKSPWGWDDTIAMVASVPFAWLCSETLIAANNGLGAHEEHITPAMSMQAYKAFVLFQLAYCTSIVLIKLSIAFTFGRIITHQKGILWTLRITVGTFMAVTTSVAIYCACQCQPIAKSWNPAIEGHCQPSNILASLSMTVTVCSIVSDIVIAILPIPLLWNVQINRSAKFAACFLLSLGLFACVCACVRLGYTLALTSTEDYLFQVYGVTVWCFAEVGVALTVGCLSTLRPLCVSCLGSSFKSSRGTSDYAKGNSNYARGTYELRSNKDGLIHSTVQAGEVTTATSDRAGSYTDNDSDRGILGSDEIRVTKAYHVSSTSAV